MSDQPERLEITPVDNEPSEVDIAVDAALGDLVRCAYHDRWLLSDLWTTTMPSDAYFHLHPALLRAYASGPNASPEVVARVNGSTIEAALRFIEWCRTDHEGEDE